MASSSFAWRGLAVPCFSGLSITPAPPRALAQDRVIAALSGFVGALALLLAAIGLYGVTSYTVTRQRSEIGIRLALGAQPDGVIQRVLSRIASLVLTGIPIGIVVSVWASRFVASLLFGVQPRDPLVIVAAIVTLSTATSVSEGVGGEGGIRAKSQRAPKGRVARCPRFAPEPPTTERERGSWRRGWDSNPRAGYPTRRFRGAPVTTTSVPLRSVRSSCSGP
jgi:FtsX-like permease family protein